MHPDCLPDGCLLSWSFVIVKNTTCFRDFVKYTSFNIAAMISVSCYILADTFFVAKGLGVEGLAALNFAIPIYGFTVGSGLLLGIGGATRYSILKSQGEIDKANQVFTNTVFIMAGFIAVFFTAGFFFADTVTRIFGTDDAVFEMTKIYLQTILLFSPMFLLQYVLQCFIRNDGAPQLSMAAMVSGSLTNILLDYVFIFLLEMGMFGAALATGLASVVSLLILSSFFVKKKNNFHLKKYPISGRLTKGILGAGFPSLVTELSVGVVMIIFNTIILRLEGNIGVAAFGIVANISIVLISIYTGIAQGIQPILCTNYGNANTANVKAILRYALILMAAISGLVYFSVFFWASGIVNIFNSEQNMVLQNVATNGIRLYFTASIFAGFNIIMSIYFTSTDHVRPAHLISILRGFFLIIPMVFLLSYYGGMTGVWLAYPATELIVAAIGLILYRCFKNRCIQIAS